MGENKKLAIARVGLQMEKGEAVVFRSDAVRWLSLPCGLSTIEYPARMTEQDNIGFKLPPPLVALAGWMIPGAGYWLIGQRTRGTIVCVAIIALYLLGLLISGLRVIEVPGYDQDGAEIRLYRGQRISANDSRYITSGSALTNGGFMSEIASKPWFVAQVLAGPLSLGTATLSVVLARQGIDRPHAPLETIGTLYTAIAGMLNLMVLIDSAYRAGVTPQEGQ